MGVIGRGDRHDAGAVIQQEPEPKPFKTGDAKMTDTIKNTDETIETIAIEAAYRAPELEPAGAATKHVQGWSFSGCDCGYSTFYYSGYCY
jgi:hypothetical protein